MSITMRQIWQASTTDRKERMANVRIPKQSMKMGIHRVTKIPTIAATTYSVEEQNGKPKLLKYITTIEFLPKRAVRVSCSCDDFKYRWEYALWKRGGAVIKYCNGEHPGVRNPQLRPGTCVAKGSLVHTSGGFKPIEEITTRDKVWTLQGFKQVLDSALTKKNANTLKIQLSNGVFLEVTPDHLVQAVSKSGSRPKWFRADELTLDHRLVSLRPMTSSITNKQLDSEALVLGYLITEHGEVGYAPMEKECSEEFTDNFKKVFGKEFRFKNSSSIIHEDSVVTEVWDKFHIKPVHSNQKELPDYVFTQSLEYRLSLVYALFQGDGWISRAATASTYGTQSRKLAEQVSRLLQGLGIEVGLISEEYSGDCDNLIYLVRPTSLGTRQLVRSIPKLAKYPVDYYTVDTDLPINSDSRRVPFLVGDLKKQVKKYWEHLREHQGMEDGIFLVADLAKEAGISSDLMVSYATRKHPGLIFKVKNPRLGRKRWAMHRKDFYRLAWKAFPKKFELPVERLEGKANAIGTSYRKLNSWLDRLPKELHSVKKFYKQYLNEQVSFVNISGISVGRSDVYDLTIKEAEHFTANGIVVHNCKHTLALYSKAVRDGIIS